ncbi:MAG: hypothetical protein U1E45_21680 [Geminicoccaceae bacterium]
MTIPRLPAIPVVAPPSPSMALVRATGLVGDNDGVPCSMIEAIFGGPHEVSAMRPVLRTTSYDRFAAMPWLVGVAVLATALWVGA